LSFHAFTSTSGTAKWLRTKNCSFGTIGSFSSESGNSRFRGWWARTIIPEKGDRLGSSARRPAARNGAVRAVRTKSRRVGVMGSPEERTGFV
jgi:hypothetical protein